MPGLIVAAAAFLGVLGSGVSPTARAESHDPVSAVIIMYHRFGERARPSTNIRLKQFEAHLAELAAGNHVVRPIHEILAALKTGRPMSGRTVGISIDDAFRSVYHEAWPRLRRAGLPFTLFIATDAVDRGGAGYMTWDQIRDLARAGVTIGSQTASHPHMPLLTPRQLRQEIEKSQRRFVEELGFQPRLFAYPYGEASTAVMTLVQESGFTAAFGQHSGALHGKSNFNYLPRFTMNERYGSRARFIQAVNALPMFATEITPHNPTLGPNPPAFGFTLGQGVGRLESLACFGSVHGKLAYQRLGQRRIEVRPPSAFRPGRARINCTLPAGGGRWRWFGFQFFIPK
jgi:peptidoglycan/xylan/chitin deacetylase (PgdA/CDA1 family)